MTVNSDAASDRVAANLRPGMRTAFIGMLTNVVLAVVKITAGLLGNSYVLIADGIESTLDIAGSAIIWGGLKLASKPPDESHPYGHGKAEPVAAIVVSLAVVAAALALSVESIRMIYTPHPAPAPFTLFILVAVIAIKEVLYRVVIRAGKDAQSTALKADAWHHRSDALTSAAAFIGISIATIMGKGYETADDWAALFACGLIAVNGVKLFMPALFELMDTAPAKELEDQVRAAARNVPGVEAIDQCRIRKMGLRFYVDLHAEVDGGISVRDGHRIAHEVKDSVKGSNSSIADVLVHIEPAGRKREKQAGELDAKVGAYLAR